MKNAQQKVYILCIYSTSEHFLRAFCVIFLLPYGYLTAILRRDMPADSKMEAEWKGNDRELKGDLPQAHCSLTLALTVG